jgi:uncharacterized membrane-anchored protein YitT (DUF2179 family)
MSQILLLLLAAWGGFLLGFGLGLVWRWRPRV